MSNSNQEKRFCRVCLRKEPPIETELIIDVNISENRFAKSDYVCNDCYRARQHEYHSGGRDRFAEYLARLHDQTVEELTHQWSDPVYAKLRELSDRVYKVWDKYNRRLPENGIRWQWICEVIFGDLWFIDANGIVEDYLSNSGFTRSKQNAARPYVLEFVVANREVLQATYRDKAYNRWIGIVKAITRKYAGKDKMVATPQWEDPTTGDMIENYFLLSREQEREYREQVREAKKRRFDDVTAEERQLVIRRQEIERREEQRQQEKDSNKYDSGGETQ